jgi:hypothetical protein
MEGVEQHEDAAGDKINIDIDEFGSNIANDSTFSPPPEVLLALRSSPPTTILVFGEEAI